MRPNKSTLYTYSLPLVKPLKMKGSEQNNRDGLIIELEDKNGIKGFGDAAPFLGLHKETLQNIIDEIKNILLKFSNLEINTKEELFSQLSSLPKCAPSLMFGLEWSLIDWFAKTKNINPGQLFNPGPNQKIWLNTLLTGTSKEVINQAKALKNTGHRSIKLKVATRSLEDDITLVHTLDEIFEGKISLRLDANQSWRFKDAVRFGKAVRAATIEYIEEPCASPELFADFYFETGLNYAFDETLVQPVFTKIRNFTGLSTLILKPSVIGSLQQIKKRTDWAKEKNLKIVFSSTFESGIGLWAIAHLASAFGEKNVDNGLDTFHWFENDVLVPAFKTDGAFLNVTGQKFTLNKSMLEKIHEQSF
jgi:o-succinylbenzoate synthase